MTPRPSGHSGLDNRAWSRCGLSRGQLLNRRHFHVCSVSKGSDSDVLLPRPSRPRTHQQDASASTSQREVTEHSGTLGSEEDNLSSGRRRPSRRGRRPRQNKGKNGRKHVLNKDASADPAVLKSQVDLPDDENFEIPRYCQEDVGGLSISELCVSHAVYNVELSWLAFNWRVLAQASDESVPLVERLKFLGISASNLDEFFAKRVGGLKRQEEARKAGRLNVSEKDLKWSPQQQLRYIASNVEQMVAHQAAILRRGLTPKLLENNIHILEDMNSLPASERSRLRRYFLEELELMLTPIKLDPGHPFPFLPSLGLGIAVVLRDGEELSSAVVNLPSNVPRWVEVNLSEADECEIGGSPCRAFLPIEQVIVNNLDSLFGGWHIIGAWLYRVTRNAELERHEDEAEDLLEMIAEEVRERMFSPFVRLEIQAGAPQQLIKNLAEELDLDLHLDVYLITDSLLDLSQLTKLNIEQPSASVDSSWDENMHFSPFVPVTPKFFQPVAALRSDAGDDDIRAASGAVSGTAGVTGASDSDRSIFSILAKRDVLLHHPHESFQGSVLRFLCEACEDPAVLAIKMTVYRTSSDSPVIEALLGAAEMGKQVAVLMELKARFDEARNVDYAQKLEGAGCSVTYGLLGLKTHCKVILVVRKEPSGSLQTYVHVGTGNYNPVTASYYTDFGLLTSNAQIGRDVVDVFKHLTGLHHQEVGYRQLLVAQTFMRDAFLDRFDREIKRAREGGRAAVLVKVNGLDDRALVHKIYEASQAGVRVDCIVRGVCRLRPGVPGLSENVRVISVIGRFLEHHRTIVFHNAGDPEYFISSADWMGRNLSRRVEVAAPILDAKLKQELRDILGCYLSDQMGAWEMQADGSYAKPAMRATEAVLSACFVGGGGDIGIDRAEAWMARSKDIGAQAALLEAYQGNMDLHRE